jgi:hypothetical protein
MTIDVRDWRCTFKAEKLGAHDIGEPKKLSKSNEK